MSRRTVQYIVAIAGECANIDGLVNPHALPHSCDYYLTNRGHDSRMIQDDLGHRDPRHTTHDTRTASSRFEEFW